MMMFKFYNVSTTLLLRPSDKIFDLTATNFINEILIKKLDTKIFVIGEDFTFGYKKQGTAKDLENQDFKVIIYKTYMNSNNKKISSSCIRKHLEAGEIGKSYSVIGKVVRGRMLARTLGFPTININVSVLIIIIRPASIMLILIIVVIITSTIIIIKTSSSSSS